MGTIYLEDINILKDEIIFFKINGDNFVASSLLVGNGEVTRYEPNIRNYGEMRLDPGTYNAGSLIAFSSTLTWLVGTVENYGLISAIDPAMIWVRALSTSGRSPDISNYGAIEAMARTEAVGYWTSDSTVFFNGTDAIVQAEAQQTARALFLHYGGTVHNEGKLLAEISGNSNFPIAESATAIFCSLGSLTVKNTGLIQATGSNPSQVIDAIELYTEAPVLIVNSGTIRGTNAIAQYASFNLPSEFHCEVENSGLIDGNVLLARGHDTVFNAGSIVGDVRLGAGNDLYDGTGGTISGTISGEDGDDILIGGDGVDHFSGGLGRDSLDGGKNVDIAIVRGASSAYSVIQMSTGVFEVSGSDGADTLINVEYLQFDDKTIRLLPGTGISVNFETNDRSTYQTEMANIRDFDGNALNGDGSWLRIGSIDVNGDGDTDQILVNHAIGRYATVGTSADGLVYFDDHSWAGETRVAGIYIDPLVDAGQVVMGSDNDSQRRFQNDLLIENINRVLGSGDYDGDGLQEVYFGLTDGTAFLHAYMHKDGNIQYANYQSEQQVIDFLTSNGYGVEIWGDWF